MTTALATDGDGLDLADARRRIKAIFIGSIGNLVEWYDFYAYAAFALYFAGAFFPTDDPVVQQLNAAVLFAIGFIVRPIGGWLFGHLADHSSSASAVAPRTRPASAFAASPPMIKTTTATAKFGSQRRSC